MLASIQPRTGLSKFAKKWPNVRKKVFKNIGEDRSRMEGQAWMDLEWWATGRKLKGQRVSA